MLKGIFCIMLLASTTNVLRCVIFFKAFCSTPRLRCMYAWVPLCWIPAKFIQGVTRYLIQKICRKVFFHITHWLIIFPSYIMLMLKCHIQCYQCLCWLVHFKLKDFSIHHKLPASVTNRRSKGGQTWQSSQTGTHTSCWILHVTCIGKLAVNLLEQFMVKLILVFSDNCFY